MKRERKIPKWWIHLSIWVKAGACAYNIGISWKKKENKNKSFFFFSFRVLFNPSGDPLGICRHHISEREMYTQRLIHHVVKWSSDHPRLLSFFPPGFSPYNLSSLLKSSSLTGLRFNAESRRQGGCVYWGFIIISRQSFKVFLKGGADNLLVGSRETLKKHHGGKTRTLKDRFSSGLGLKNKGRISWSPWCKIYCK
jgi:hypothetical protein